LEHGIIAVLRFVYEQAGHEFVDFIVFFILLVSLLLRFDVMRGHVDWLNTNLWIPIARWQNGHLFDDQLNIAVFFLASNLI
jgi:NADH:ubiquinone oxidoreductase subunit 5 (subunit L)/multisubunit Na+/H+ antiporter MnhA subunit